LALAIMPIITGGLAAIPTAEVGAASVVSNVVRQTSAALGLAVLTAIWTTQQAQQLAARAALLPGDAATSHLDSGSPAWQGIYAVYQQTQLHVFVAAMDDLILIAAGLSALGALAALLMQSGRPPGLPPKQANSPAIRTRGPADKGLAGNGLTSNGSASNGSAESFTAERDPTPRATVLAADHRPDALSDTTTELPRR
jgi:hypothetical protein